MRISGWLSLAVLCSIAASSLMNGSSASARSTPAEPKKVVIHEEFKGYGLTQKDAEADALKTACDWLTAQAKLGWTPSPDYLREKGMVEFGRPTEEEFEKSGLLKVVTAQLNINAAQTREIQTQARQERMESRHRSSLLVLAGVVGLLLVVGGYLRLEEATKGYYTRLLRLAAVSILLVLVVGLYVVG